jgi:hypothetical protein
MLAPKDIALFGQTGAQTSQLMHASVIFSAIAKQQLHFGRIDANAPDLLRHASRKTTSGRRLRHGVQQGQRHHANECRELK